MRSASIGMVCFLSIIHISCNANDALTIEAQKKEIVALKQELTKTKKLAEASRLAANKCGVTLFGAEFDAEKEEAFQKLMDIAQNPLRKEVTTKEMKFSLDDISRTKVWRYDRISGGNSTQVTPDENKEFIVVDYSIKAGDSQLKLPRLAAFVATRKGPEFVGYFNTEFFKWQTHDSYLGSEKDPHNDFGSNGKITFSSGMQAPTKTLEKGAIIVGALFPGCLVRRENSLTNPPTNYDVRDCPKPKSNYHLFNDMLPLALLK